MNERHRREFGDFQTPAALARDVCMRLADLGIRPDVVIEPTCGAGAFVLAALESFGAASVLAFEFNPAHISALRRRLAGTTEHHRVHIEQADFFRKDWQATIDAIGGSALVLGNFPWVTNAEQSAIGGTNLPAKSNFLGHGGFDAISGRANFDISEWMLFETLRWFRHRGGDIAMLVKSSVARRVLAQAALQGADIRSAEVVTIDARRHFGAAVDACLLVMRLGAGSADRVHASLANVPAAPMPVGPVPADYTVYAGLGDVRGRRVGHRMGMVVRDLDAFDASSFLLGDSPQRWRSGVKHDAAPVMELTQQGACLVDRNGEAVDIERLYLYPLLKGGDVAGGGLWRGRYMLVTQHNSGEATSAIARRAPRTWAYLERNSRLLDRRASAVYRNAPRFAVFGVGDYTFRPWKIAICGLYKTLTFALTGPIGGKPVVFDDTVYYLSFDTEAEARCAYRQLDAPESRRLLTSLVFWDEKRPIKSSILNALDWSRVVSA